MKSSQQKEKLLSTQGEGVRTICTTLIQESTLWFTSGERKSSEHSFFRMSN